MRAQSGSAITDQELTEYFINGSVTRQSAVKNTELSFQSAGNIIPSSTRMNHGGQELNVNYTGKIPGFFKIVETFHLHELANYLVCDLKIFQVY